tara:strand:- start:141 stop:1376 length:1236 start_codon:yes stop_codon:yes gene_type:complete
LKYAVFFLLIIFSSLSHSDEIRIIANEDNIEQLLKIDPDNIDFLSIYGVKLVKSGKARSAIEVYKKIINRRPDLLVYYLELARLQFFLNELDDAKINFEYVYSKNLPVNVKYNVRNYLKKIENLKPSSVSYNFKLSFNDNINNGTYSDTIRLFGIPFKVDENAKAKGSYEFYTGIEANHQFKSDNLKLNVGGKLDHSNFTSSAYDRLKYTFITGPEYQIKNHQIKLDLTLSKDEMNWNDVTNSKELRLSHFFNYSPQLRFSSTLSFDENDYYNNANYNTEGKALGLSADLITKSGISYSANIRLTDNDAVYEPYGNEKKYVSASIGSQLPLHFYINASVGLETTKYDAYQSIWLTTREDDLRFISLNLKNERVYFNNFYPQINFTIRDNDSNVDVYKTSSNSASLYFVKDF